MPFCIWFSQEQYKMSVSRDLSRRMKSFRKDGRRRYQENNVDSVPLDLSQDPGQLLTDIFCSISARTGVSTGRNLGHLNNFIKILCNIDNLGTKYSQRDIMLCLKPALVSDVKEVRAACIRALRYLVNDADSVLLLSELNLDCFIIKCLDISHFNEVERIQCLRLIRKAMHLAKREKNAEKLQKPAIPQSFVACIISISCDGAEERDRVYRTCLAVLCELAVLEPALVIQSGGLLVLLRAILECHMYRRINESLCMSLALLLNHPMSRSILNLEFNFDSVFAPYTDIMYRLHVDIEESQIREEQEMRILASKMAVVSVLHSWPGLVHLGQSCALNSFLSTLRIPNSTTRRATLSVLYEVLCFNEPKWTDEFAEAFESIGPKLFQESWRLTNMFVAAEGKFFVPPTCSPRPDLINCYMAVLLSILIRDHLIQHLVDVVLSSDEHASVSACILLGAVLHLCSRLLPDSNNISRIDGTNASRETVSSIYRECLPELMKKATSDTCSREDRLRASVAVCRLQEVHNFLNKPATSSSIYLNELLFRIKVSKHRRTKSDRGMESELKSGRSVSATVKDDEMDDLTTSPTIKKNRSITIMRDFSEEQLLTKIKETQVLVAKEHTSWKWDAISSLLVESYSHGSSAAQSLQYIGSDDTVQRFIKRLVAFFVPSEQAFCKLDLPREGFADHNRLFIQSGCHLMRFLANSDEEGIKILTLLTSDIAQYLLKLIKDTDASNKVSIFGSTCAQEYFLLLGALTMSKKGSTVLKKAGIFDLLMKLAHNKTHESLIKLIVSSLFYTGDGPSFLFLKKVLVSCNEAARVYATSYLRLLLRAGTPGFISWGINLLITQLYDTNNNVASEALDVLNEACDDDKYHNAVVNLRPSVLHLGEPGALFVCRFMSHPTGFQYSTSSKYLMRELERWWDSANERYVLRVEELLNLSLTSFERPNQQGGFVRRSGIKKKTVPVYVPSHIYGELCRHKKGCEILEKENIVPRLLKKLELALAAHEQFCKISEKREVNFSSYQLITDHLLKIKSCLWALSHVGSSSYGIEVLKQHDIIKLLTNLAQHSSVHSIRGTCLYCLSIISQTVTGAEELRSLGWLSVSRKALHSNETAVPPARNPTLKSSSWSETSVKSETESVMLIKRSLTLQPGGVAATSDLLHYAKSAVSLDEKTRSQTSHEHLSVFGDELDSMSAQEVVSIDIPLPPTPEVQAKTEKLSVMRKALPERLQSLILDMSEVKQVDTKSAQHRNAVLCLRGRKKAVAHFRKSMESFVGEHCCCGSFKVDDGTEDFHLYSSHPELNLKPSSPVNYSSLVDTFSQSTPDLSDTLRPGLSSQKMEITQTVADKTRICFFCNMRKETTIQKSLTFSAEKTQKDEAQSEAETSESAPPSENSWRFNKLAGLTAVKKIGEQQFKRKLSSMDLDPQDKCQDDCSNMSISNDLRQEIEQSMTFVGIALPEDLDMLFKHETPSIESSTPIAVIPQRTRHKHLPSKQGHFFTASPNEDMYSSASVRSDTMSFLEDVTSAPGVDSTEEIHQNIVRLVVNLGSSIGVKLNETALLVMKEKFPNLFDSVKLFYSVSSIMAEYNFRLTTRRFVQELFHDIPFTEIHTDAKQVLERVKNEN